MIEGLRVAPFFYDAIRGDDMGTMGRLDDCRRCISECPGEDARQSIGCGWLPLRDDATPYTPPGLPDPHVAFDADGNPPTEYPRAVTVCPGYTVKLPQVREALRARMHWEKGTLHDRYQGQELTALLLDALEISEVAHSDLVSYKSRPKD